MSVIEADGILCTEWDVQNGTESNETPTEVDAESIRSAHIYVNIFKHVRENFAIAGLLSYIQVSVASGTLVLIQNIPLHKIFFSVF